MKFYLETERLIIREIQESDVNGMFELDSNKQVHLYLGNKPIKSIKDAEKNIAIIRNQYKERGIGRFATIEKTTGKFIGWSGLKLNVGENEALNGFQDFIDIGYRFIPKYWKKGYGLEAALVCLNYGFKIMNYETIYGAADVKNIGSNKILQKIGLQFANEFNYQYKDKNTVRVNWYELKKENYGN